MLSIHLQKIGIQIAHAGRKASTDLPWNGGDSLAPDSPNGWQKSHLQKYLLKESSTSCADCR